MATLLLVAQLLVAAAPADGPFEAEIRAFEAADRAAPPPKAAVLFIGSSSIRLWKTLAEDFPQLTVINRGFGGSQVEHAVRYIDRMVVPYAPRLVVMYAGGNDLNSGKAPEQVLADVRAFVSALHAKLPRARFAYISVAPNPARWAQVGKVRALNGAVEAFTRTDRRLAFLDVFPHMLGPDAQPRPELFVKDRLHMNAAGYALWRQVLTPRLRALAAPAGTRHTEGRTPGHSPP